MPAPELLRYSLLLAYDGTHFRGWQLQPEGRTVQGELERVLGRLTGGPARVVGSGRTDRGVHALAQVAAADLPPGWTAPRLRAALNALLPRDLRVTGVRRVAHDFHPRYDAVRRSYEYRLGTTAEARTPFLNRWCWDLSRDPPPLEGLEAAARLLPGERSFRKFAKAGQPERGERCHLIDARWERWPEGGLRFRVTADRYLHHMVRYLVGTMVAVARGTRPLAELDELLTRPETPLLTSPPAPPEGLFLARVEYPPDRMGTHPDRDPPAEDGPHP